MKTKFLINFALYLALAIPIILGENSSPYPMLYFSSSDVEEMRAKASTTHVKIAADLREAGKALLARPDQEMPPKSYSVFAARWNEVYGNSLCGFAMYSFLYPDDVKVFDLLKTYMDRMSSYQDWYVAESHGKDQVPIGHSLTGFATAYDLLYDRLDEKRRENYYDTIKRHTQHLFMLSKQYRFGWTKQYIHNHAASNFVGLLLGALIVSVQEPQLGSVWIESTKKYLDFSMEVLSHITDGSLDEGVAYGSYTSRGLTQYVYLAKRHLKTDHTNNPWLKEHFWFFYKTLLPGFQRSVGIADANHNWFFGPGSQLVFLDAYVLKNGYGNWLAAKIRRARPKNKPLAMTHSHVYSMLHTEYIFYNASLRPQRPLECGLKTLHVFHDWGVVAYGGAQDMKKGNTFLSFKSSVLNGEAVENMMYNDVYPKDVILPNWDSFNPGHEHPDQNSFIFAPNGRYFITEALYGPKLTYLDNVIVFSTPNKDSCLYPWKGQIGECSKWLKYTEYEKGMRGEILTAVTTKDSLTFIAGESVGAYSKSLGLDSVFRGLLLLNPEVLIVFDTIKLLPDSKTKKASAFFHNMLHRFKETSPLGYKGAKVQYPEGSYSMFSLGSTYLDIHLHSGVQPAGLREGPTNYINVTFDLKTDVTNIVHVFSGPNYLIKSASILPRSGKTGIYLSLDVNGVKHLINVSTSTKSSFKSKSVIKERIDVTGFAGYASVRVGNKVSYLGLDNSAVNSGNSDLTGTSLKQSITQDEKIFTSSSKFTLSSSISECAFSLAVSDKKLENAGQSTSHTYAVTINYMFLLSGAVFILFVVFVNSGIKVQFTRKIRHSGRRPIYGIVLLVTLVVLNIICIDVDGNNSCIRKLSRRNDERGNFSEHPSIPATPFIFITSLPASGSELLESIFKNPEQFLYLTSSQDGLTIPVKDHDASKPNVCLWPSLQNKFNLQSVGWVSSLIGKPRLHFNQEQESKTVRGIRRYLRQHFTSSLVLNDNTGFWNTKIPWIRRVVGKENFQPMFVVRDPRSWINAILQDKDHIRQRSVVSSLTSAYLDIEKSCDSVGLEHPQFYQRFKQLASMRRRELHTVEKLSIIWAISVANALGNEEAERGQWPLHIIRFEDLLDFPEKTSSDIFSKLGLPLGIRYMNKLTRLVRSEFFKVPFDNIITPSTTTLWKISLSERDVARIEEICCPVMKTLNYECKTT